ncbi:MAG: class I SAM-dependent methyltransferase [Burkholderiales bacterium]|nr:class I SAM-dependent methyltransferase [Burkholderiales bacterium]
MSKGFANPRETWDARFSSDEYIFGTEPNVWLAQHADLFKPGMRVLAVADGEGRNSVWMAQQGLQVDAFDISPVGIEKAKKLAQQQGVEVNFSIHGVEDYPWTTGDYDAVVAIFIQFADPDTRATLFKRMKSALKPDGVVLLQGYTPKQLEYKTGGPPNLSHLYTEGLLQDAFGDLDISELRTYEDILTEGTQHHGQSALIGLVARRPFGCNFQ